MDEKQSIIIYQSEGGDINVEVKLVKEDLWLSLNQIAALFCRDKSVISRHLKNIFLEEELDQGSVVAFFATTANDAKTYQVEHFNLDAIISVGYRVNSKRGTQFRQWSSQVLKSHLYHGYSLNKEALNDQKISALQQTLTLLTHTLVSQDLVTDIGQEILTIIIKYAKTWDTLLCYDEERFLESDDAGQDQMLIFDDLEAIKAISQLKEELMAKAEASTLFGNQKDNQLSGILAALNQTFDGVPVYRTHIERAANLLYFIIKDHPFNDGNKRIGCFLFLIYLHKAGLQTSIPANNSLISIALLVAESNPKQKDLLIQLIMRLLEE